MDLSKIVEEEYEDSPSPTELREDESMAFDDLENLKSKDIFLIDFGLAQFYIDEKTDQHLEETEQMNFVGTTNFSSKNSHELRQ